MPEHDPFTATASPEAKTSKHRTPSETQEPENERLNLIFVGVSERSFRAHAIEEANRRYNVATSGEGFIGVLKALKRGNFKEVPGKATQAFKQSIKGGIGREITLSNAFYTASREITDSQNLKLHEGGEAEDYERALLYRFNEAADKYEDVIQKAAGEKRIKFNLATSPEDEEPISNAVKTDLRELLTNAVSGNFDNDEGAFNKKAFNEAVKDFEVRTANDPDAAPYLNSSALRANNMYQMVLALRARLSTIKAANPYADDATINNLFNGVLDQTDVVFGEAHVGSHAETGRTIQERIADKLSHVPLLNPETVAIAAGALLTVGQIARRRTIIAAAAAAGTAATGAIGGAPLLATMAAIGLTGAALGGLRGATAARQEHILRARRHARGEHDPLEGVGLYEGKTFTEATDELDILYDEHGELRQDNLSVTMQIYAQASARLRLSVNHQNGDLLIEDTNHPEELKREDQFNRFIVACSKVKADLRKILNDAIDHQDTATLNALGIQEGMREELWDAEDPLEVILESLISGNKGVLEVDVLGEIRQDMAEKDLAQKKILRSSSLKGMVTGAVVSLVGASIGQAIEAGANRHITSFASGAYEKIHELFAGKGNTPTPQEAPITTSWTINRNLNIQAPDGFELAVDQNGNYILDGPNGMHIEDLRIQANGKLADESIKTLQEHGINTTTDFRTVTEPVPAQTVDANADNFITSAESDKVKIYTDVNRRWIDNGTPGSDYNEKLLGSAHLRADGTIAIDMSRLHVEPGAKLELSLTMTTATGDKMLVLTPDSDGIVRIRPEDGSIYESFKKGAGSNMHFEGKWMQAIIDKGASSNGHNVDVLATDIGLRENTFTVKTPAHEIQSVGTINTLHYSAPISPAQKMSQVGWSGPMMPVTARTRRGLNVPPTAPAGSAYNTTTIPPQPQEHNAPQPDAAANTPTTKSTTPEANKTDSVTTQAQKGTPSSEQEPKTAKHVPAPPAAPQPQRNFPSKKLRGGARRARAANAAAAKSTAEAPTTFAQPDTTEQQTVMPPSQTTPTPAVTLEQQEQNTTVAAAAPTTTEQTTRSAEVPSIATETAAAAAFSPADLAARLNRIRPTTTQEKRAPAPQGTPQNATTDEIIAQTPQAFTPEQTEGASTPSEPSAQPTPQAFTVASTTTSPTVDVPIVQTTPQEVATSQPQPKAPSQELVSIASEPSFGRSVNNPAASIPSSTDDINLAARQLRDIGAGAAKAMAEREQAAKEAQKRTEKSQQRESNIIAEKNRRAYALINGNVQPDFKLTVPTLPSGRTPAERQASLRMIENAIQEVATNHPDLTPAAIFNPANSKNEVDQRLRRLQKRVLTIIHPDNFKGITQAEILQIINNASTWWTNSQNSVQLMRFAGRKRTNAQAGYPTMNLSDVFADLLRQTPK